MTTSDSNPEQAREAADEGQRLRYLRMVVDLTSNLLVQGRMRRAEAEALVEATRRQVLQLFPDKEATYELILAPRFARLMDEFVGPPTRRGRVLPFRTTS